MKCLNPRHFSSEMPQRFRVWDGLCWFVVSRRILQSTPLSVEWTRERASTEELMDSDLPIVPLEKLNRHLVSINDLDELWYKMILGVWYRWDVTEEDWRRDEI